MSVTIIGTSHIAKQSINEIKKFITEKKPDLVALELDLPRAQALLEEKRNKITLAVALQIGIKGYLFAKIGQLVQQKLGKLVGVAPGSEMKTALELARKNKMKVAFIDQPLPVTLIHFSKNLSWKEKGRFVIDLWKGTFFPKKQLKELGLEQFDLRRVPQKEVIAKMMKQTEERYPNVYKTLVEDRNKYMVKQLVKILREDPTKKILVVVGAGHEEGMKELLNRVEIVK